MRTRQGTVTFEPGTDLRLPAHRRELFLRFYAWSLLHQSFPGGVHYVLPHVARELDLTYEQRCWLAFLNGNTQNPVTSLLLFQAAPDVSLAEHAVSFWEQYYPALQWDTDRRYHKSKFGEAVAAYVQLDRWGSQLAWQDRSWDECWQRASEVPYMGRLSTWSYLEYLKILGLGVPDADTLKLEDFSGSRSHRNGLCLVTGHDDWIGDKQLGRYDGPWTEGMLMHLAVQGMKLREDAWHRVRLLGGDTERSHRALGYLSLESALCTFKSWHKRNRRYPGCYNDMLYDRIRHGEINFGHRFGLLWDARRAALPSRLLLEDNPGDPGCVPVKQNWFLDHGEVINMTTEWPDLTNGFEAGVTAGSFGERRTRWI
jgi:hypothetical protein